MEIKRPIYLNKLIERKDNGLVKVITGMRRCGKSYLLFKLFYDYLLSIGIKSENIIRISLEDDLYEDLHDRKELSSYIRKRINEVEQFYIFLDEIQFVNGFEKLLNGLNSLPNVDLFVTGSNSKFLSTDVLTEFRGRGDEIRVYPLSFQEFYSVYDSSKEDAWAEFFTYGGLPLILSRRSEESKSQYLKDVLNHTYLADIVDRHNLHNVDELDTVLNILASSTGSLTNPLKISRTFKSKEDKNISDKTVSSYINHFIDAFMLSKSSRYEIKGRKYIGSPFKFYFTDVGIRNAKLNFRQQEENHIMENIIYNELLIRGYNVDVGIVETFTKINNKTVRVKHEVDFVCNLGNKRFYIQAALEMATEEKIKQEEHSLKHIDDAFKKIIIVNSNVKPWYNENGILIIGLYDFLLEPSLMDL